MTWYITIQSDDRNSRSIDTPSILAFLSSIPVLKQTDDIEFRNTLGLPSVVVVLTQCNKGGYSSYGEYIPEIDIIELICYEYEHPEWYENIATQIAIFLDWEAWEESEERQIYDRSQI
jgi:hypothetical protein